MTYARRPVEYDCLRAGHLVLSGIDHVSVQDRSMMFSCVRTFDKVSTVRAENDSDCDRDQRPHNAR